MRFLNFFWEVPLVIDGETVREARELAGLSQERLAVLLHVSGRTVGSWERNAHKIPRGKEREIRELLAEQLREPGAARPDEPHLREASDAELLSEIARRFARTAASNTTGGGGRGGDTAAMKDEADAAMMLGKEESPDRVGGGDERPGSGETPTTRSEPA